MPVWYSKLERAIEEKMPNSAPADQVRGIVKGAGVKPEEAEWSDLEGYLAAHPKADKGELLQHLKDNQVQVQEVWKGGRGAGSRDEPVSARSSNAPADSRELDRAGREV